MFSLTWPASMQIYWKKRKRLHKKRVQLPQDWFGTQTWPPFASCTCLRSPKQEEAIYSPRFSGPYCKLRILVFFHRFVAQALGHKYGRHDVMWKHTIFEKTYVISHYRLSYYFSYSENVYKTAKKLFGKKSCFKRYCISKFGQFDQYQTLTFFFSGWPNTLWANKRMHQ